ncbi:hypothetical protein O181_125635 [Austropuccinia psidii MF-1]|uniref:Uncharacterized protein n=1 Tax=Austropuccinia psidii MF-1 TaxID=1389203 RepID=A0A9Q3Q6A8_9BASI|nr:hypothetical protein [Austropuccinia psidii MF-1]
MGPGHGTPEAPANLSSGGFQWPPWPMDHRTPKWAKTCPEAIKFKNHHKKGHDPSSMVGLNGPQIHHLRHFQGQWGQDPPSRCFEGISIRESRAKHQVSPFTLRYMIIYSLAIKF